MFSYYLFIYIKLKFKFKIFWKELKKESSLESLKYFLIFWIIFSNDKYLKHENIWKKNSVANVAKQKICTVNFLSKTPRLLRKCQLGAVHFFKAIYPIFGIITLLFWTAKLTAMPSRLHQLNNRLGSTFIFSICDMVFGTFTIPFGN